MTKAIAYVISIYKFEQKCVVLKGMLQSPRLKYHRNNIGIDQSLSNSAIFEHIFIKNIKKLYQNDGKCDVQKNSKILLRLLWFLLLKDSLITSPDLPCPQHQSRNQVIENHCVFSLKY